MRSLAAALALLLAVGVANSSDSRLKVGFKNGHTYIYDLQFNISSAISGLGPQVSKSSTKMTASIYAEDIEDTDGKQRIFIQFKDVRTSGSIADVGSLTDPMELKPEPNLEKHLKKPIQATLENGKVTAFTLDRHESLASAEYKRAFLRCLDMPLNEHAVKSGIQPNHPVTYNLTRSTPLGKVRSHYTFLTSPYPNFPEHHSVVNMTRFDNYADIPYLSYFFHHNMELQGCPSVCKKEHGENSIPVGCPPGYEQYQTPTKQSFVQHHNFLKIKNNLRLDSARSTEHHSYHAKGHYYIDNLIEMGMTRKRTVREPIEEPTGQRTYTNLYDWGTEAREEVINKYCHYTTSKDAVRRVKEILGKIANIVINKNTNEEDEDAEDIGELLIRAKKEMELFERKDFEKIAEQIVNHDDLPQATEEEKILRQIWLEFLPLIGTHEAVSYIVEYINENINKKDRIISAVEATEILKGLPLNVQKPSLKTIQKLQELPKAHLGRRDPGYPMFQSASLLAVARTIRAIFDYRERRPEDKDGRSNYLQMLLKETDDHDISSRSLEVEADKFVKEIGEKLKETTRNSLKANIIHALTHTNRKSAFKYLHSYVLGDSKEETPSYRNFVRTFTIYALHNMVVKHPKKVQDLVMPICFNKTEPPKVRIAACDVWMKTDLTLGHLQFAAEETHDEHSREVASWWTTTLETYGNSTQPCDQKIAHLIKKVWPQVKKFYDGKNHAQNIRQTYSSNEGYGFEHSFKKTPSNESAIPSSMLLAFKSYTDSLQDTWVKYAINAQGFNSFNMWDNIQRFFNIKDAQNIPRSKEHEIFPEVEIANRGNEFWRFTIFERMFYSMSYHYMDEQEFENGDFPSLIMQNMKNYMKFERNGTVWGSLFKIFLSGSYEQRAFANVLHLPVESHSVQPIIMAVNFKLTPKDGGYTTKVNPWVHVSEIHSSSILHLGDCKKIGSYHVRKTAASYPIEFSFGVKGDNFYVSYKPEESSRKILSHVSEPATYASTHKVEALPPSSERSIIKTIRHQIVRNSTVDIPLLASFKIGVVTEDVVHTIPQNPEQLGTWFTNPYWGQSHVEITRVPDQSSGPNTEIEIHVNVSKKHVEKQEHSKDDEWMNTIAHDHDEKNFASEHGKVKDQFRKLSHKEETLRIVLKHTRNNQVSKESHVVITRKGTYDGYLQGISVNCTTKSEEEINGAYLNAVAIYPNTPNVLNYSSFGKQRAIVLVTIQPHGKDKPTIAAKGTLRHRDVLPYRTTDRDQVKDKPETDEECLRDEQNGKGDSVPCIRAKNEAARFNEGRFTAIWSQDISDPVKIFLERLDLYVKSAFLGGVNIENKRSKPNTLRINWNYEDKLTQTPFYNADVITPTQITHYNYVQLPIQPPSSIYSLEDTYVQHFTNNTYPATCSLMNEYVRTFDLKTFRFPKEKSCSYILAAHCVLHKKFAVNVKIDAEKNTTTPRLFIGKHSIVLTPGKKGEYHLRFDQQIHTVNHSQPILLNEEQDIHAVVQTFPASESSYIKIVAARAGMNVIYDGKQVKVQVHPRYKGELCGLCSEFNGEIFHEYRSPEKCLLNHSDDFIRSNALGKCHSSVPIHKSICNEDDYRRTDSHQDENDETDKNAEYEPRSRKNNARS